MWLLVVITAFHLWTGLVHQQGGFGFELVIKPWPMLAPRFGGGENNAWQRENPGKPEPWWLRGDYLSLAKGDWEDGDSDWWLVYVRSWSLCMLAWLILVPYLAIRASLGAWRRASGKGGGV